MKSLANMFVSGVIFLMIVVGAPLVADAQATYAPSGSGGGGWNISNVTGYGLPQQSLYTIIENILFWLLAIFGIVGVLGFVISGLLYLLSAGNDDMMKKAKSAMTYSIYGVIVGLAGVVVIMAVDAILNGSQFF